MTNFDYRGLIVKGQPGVIVRTGREKVMQRRGVLFFVLVWMSVVFPPTAHAYLDPGSGSMLLQVILGGAAGLAVLIKLYWQRVLLLFGIGPAEDQAEHAVREDSQAAPETQDAAQQE